MTSFVIFDRDGTLIEHVHHLINIEDVRLKPDIGPALLTLKEHGFKFGIISNQSVIGRGMTSIENVNKINSKLTSELEKIGVKFEFILICPHLPADNCNCRKPRTDLGVKAENEFGVNFESSYLVGDQESDLKFGLNMGCKVIQIKGNAPKSEISNYYSDTLTATALWIIDDSSK